jgi:hypothetical protein
VFKKITILLLFVHSCVALNAQVVDDFNDGDFTISPVWTPGIATDFKDTLGQLRSNNLVASSNSYISTPSTLANNCQWEVFVNLKFATSGANYVDVYLTADNANLSSGTLNGYFVRIGNTSDEISLYRNVSGTITEILDGLDGTVSSSSNNLIKLKVIRDAANQFTLSRDMSGTGTSYITEGTITDATFTSSAFFGFFIQQSTASFFKKHFIDDVYVGPIIFDTAPPTLISATPLSSTTLDVLFSEPLNVTSAQTLLNYTVDNSIGNPSVATLDGGNPALMHLTFASSFLNLVNYEIVINNVADLALNGINNDTLNFTYFVSDTAIARDVVINELMADETPQVGLPDAEFIELFNNSAKNLDLAGWTIDNGGTPVSLPSYVLTPGQYLILCSPTQVVNYSIFGTTLGVTSFPGLTNAGDEITLKNNFGTVIDYVNYDDSWYNDGTKDDGGWTLEQINPNAGCLNAANWSASNDVAGGTPGAVNSIYNTTPDITPPTIVSSNLNSNTQIALTFSEAVDTSAVTGFVFTVNNGITVSSTAIVPTATNQLIVNFTTPIDTGIVYTLTATNVSDCEGNGTGLSSTTTFILAFQSTGGELIINEVLFHPETGVSDFVEIYNNSTKVINLKNWEFANIEADTIDNNKIISTVDLLINPGEYLAFTVNKSALIDYYTQAMVSRIIEIPSMPALDADSSTIILINNQNIVSDRFSYIEEEMQFDLLQSFTGVSLERLDFNRATNDAGNWHSAAEAVGFATPGYLNSQYNPNNAGDDELSLSTEIFSPDNDGYQDVINFNYLFTENGYVGNATLYDVRGREIKKLLRNELLANDGVFSWDGITEKNEKASIGIYIIYFEYFNLSGTVKKIKKSFVLAGKFE